MAFREVSMIEKDWRSQNMTYFDMNEDQASSLRNIAQGHTQSAFTAQAYLFLRYREETPFHIGEWPTELEDYMEEDMYIIFKDGSKQVSGDIAVYPNPADEYVWIESNMPKQNLQMHIYNTNGHLIEQISLNHQGIYTLDTHSWPAGIYYYQIRNESKLIQKDKLIILK